MISIIWISENFKIDFVFIFHIKFIFLDVLWEASIVKLWSVYGLTRMAYQRNALLRWMQHECPNVHHVMLLSIIIKVIKTLIWLLFRVINIRPQKVFFALNGFREKHILSHSMYSERCHYVTSNDQLILTKHTIFIVFNKIKPAVHQVRFLNNLMIGVCILCEEGFQESSAINEKIQQHNSGLITHWTKSSV